MNPEYRAVAPSLSDGQCTMPQCDSSGRLVVCLDRGPVVPPGTGAVVTPSDSAANVWSSLWVGGAGNITVDMATSGTDVLFSGVAAGTWMPISVVKVKATGTTATLITGVK